MSDSTFASQHELLNKAGIIIRKLKEKLATFEQAEQAQTEPVAIVGIGCRFPGGADSPQAFWELLDAGRDAVKPLDRRWTLCGAFPSEKVPRWAGLLTCAVDEFDAPFFGISPREARSMDPQHRLLLEVAWEALENASIPPRSLDKSRTGVFIGACLTDYLTHMVSRQPPAEQDVYSTTGNMLSIAAGRLSYTLGLQGPCLTVDTACSSSLVSIHLAYRSLRGRESDLALAGGVNLLLSPETMKAVALTQALSPDGRCRTFDTLANGFVRGEGCGLVVLKRLSDAQRDGDRIWALIRGSAVNQDGRSTGLTTPNRLAQEALLREALKNAGAEAETLSYVETHGTGTPLGDPIEVDALRAVLGKPRADGTRCVLGAVKTNIGHLEGAAGVAGLIKAVLALGRERIPQNLNFRTLNAHIELEGTSLQLATEPMAWPRGAKPRVAGVSSFGFSGTNAHVILEEAPAKTPARSAPERNAELFVLSAHSEQALLAQAARLRAHLQAHPELSLSDVAYSLATTRSALEQRLAIAATSRDGLLAQLDRVEKGQAMPGMVHGHVPSSRGKLAFLFTGQGSQLPGMGRGLYQAWPAFREALDRCTSLFDRELLRPLGEVMWAEAGSAEAALLDQTGYTQPALFVLEYSLFALWRSWGVTPDLVAGHSIGELVAACVAGVFTLEDAIRLCAARGKLMQALPAGGAMVSIAACEAAVAAAVAPHAGVVSIAAVNGPEQVVVAGEQAAVTEIATAFSARGVRTKALPVSHAFHSSQMDPMLAKFRQVAESIRYQRPAIALLSNVSGKLYSGEACTAEYWVRHVREAVRFAEGVQALHEAGARTFVEVGPKAMLLGLVPACLPEVETTLVPSLRGDRGEEQSVLEALSGVWIQGVSVDWQGVFPAGGHRVELPTYAWQRQRYWVKPPEAASRVGQATGHPLLGARVPTAGSEAIFEAVVALGIQPWLADHRVAGQVLVPGAAIAEWMRAAAAAQEESCVPQVVDLVIQEPLVLPEQGALRVQVVITQTTAEGMQAVLYSQAADSAIRAAWTQHAAGRIEFAATKSPEPLDLLALRARCAKAQDVGALYAQLEAVGFGLGAAFHGLQSVWSGVGESLGEVQLPAGLSAAGYGMHPALLDAAFHAMGCALVQEIEEELWLPFEMGRIAVYREGAESAWVHVQAHGNRAQEAPIIEVKLADASGALIAEVSGIQLRRADREALQRKKEQPPPDGFYRLAWQEAAPREPPREPKEGTWLVVAGADSLAAQALCARLPGSVRVQAEGLAVALKQIPSPLQVVCLWESGTAESPAATAQRVAAQGLSVVHALLGRSAVRLWWSTTSAVAVHSGDPVAVGTSTVWGLGRSVMQEHPELGCILIDLDMDSEDLGPLLWELSAQGEENQIAWRAGKRYVARLGRAGVIPAPKPPLRAAGTVLITGGLGALGLRVAQWLAQQGVPHLLLTGRRGIDTPGAAAAVAELHAMGSRVTVAAVDVAERAVLQSVLAQIPNDLPLRGVVHAAGVLDDGILAEQTPERFARVLLPKVDGAWNLHELLAGQALDFFVLFSSGASLLGSAGQSNYAAANAFLDALALHRRALGLPGQSLSWGGWSDSGMTAALGASQQARLARQGMKWLSPAEGLALFAQALTRPEAHLGAMHLDMTAVGQAVGWPVPPLWRALLRKAAARAEPSAAGNWAAHLAKLPPERREQEVRSAVQKDVARVLSLDHASEVPLEHPFRELGLDSLMATELRNALGKRIGKTLPATLAFEHPTVNALTRWLLVEILLLDESKAELPATKPASPQELASRTHGGGHPLLGEVLILSTQTNTHLWQTALNLNRLPWLADHRMQEAVVLPVAVYVEMALGSGADLFDKQPFRVTELSFLEALVLTGDTVVQVVTTEEQSGRLSFQVASRVRNAGSVSFRVHARGGLQWAERTEGPARLDLSALRARLQAVRAADVYAAMSAMGPKYGPAFLGMLELWHGEGEALGRVQLPAAAGSQTEYQLHPALLDACFQVVVGALAEGGETAPWMPVTMETLRLFEPAAGELFCHVRLAPKSAESPEQRRVDLCLINGEGLAVAEIRGLTMQRPASGVRHREEDDWFLGVDWEPVPVSIPRVVAGRWLLLGKGDGVGTALRSALEAAGHSVVHIEENHPSTAELRSILTAVFAGQAPMGVVHLGSLDVDGKLDAREIEMGLVHGCDSTLSIVQALLGMGYRHAPRLWLVTRGAQAVFGSDVSVAQAPLLGLCRVIALEHAELRCARLDLDPACPAGEVQALLSELLADDAEEEIVLRGGERRVSRLVYRLPEAGERERVEPAGAQPFRLEFDRPGVLDHLVLRAMERRAPGPGEVEIAVEAAGLSFLDVLQALGVIPSDLEGGPGRPLLLGHECAGRIVAIGEGVSGLSVGDPVVALAGAALATHVTTSATLVLRRPFGLTAVQAAALPLAYLTALHSLDRVAHLTRGERVLIHAATGGVGLAAVQWAQHAGAEIYATAGTPQKRAYLESLGVRYVSDSRSDRFVADVLAWTNSKGVDIVLNSLSGNLCQKSFGLLRDHGRFVELHKENSSMNHQLGSQLFSRNLSFSLVDMQGMIRQQATRVRALFGDLLGLLVAGTFSPPPIETFPISQADAADAFRKMAQTKHIGKVVLTLPDTEVQIRVPVKRKAAIRKDGSYLVTDGLGTLGLSVANWLAEQGAGHLVLVPDSGAGSAEQQSVVASLEAKGARVTVAKADVAQRVEVESILREIADSTLPLRGIVYAAGVMNDGLLLQQTSARLRAALGPKVLGALHLHELTRQAALDFFVMYSSAAGLLGSPGQGSYAAHNAFLDALAHHRRAQGLPALSIDWEEQNLTPAERLMALEHLLGGHEAQVGVVPQTHLQWTKFTQAAVNRRLSRLLAAQPSEISQLAGDRALVERLIAAEPKARIAMLQKVLRTQLSQVLRIPEDQIDMNASLASLGIDALMGLDLRNRITAVLGIEVSADLLRTYPTLLALAGYLANRSIFVAGSLGWGIIRSVVWPFLPTCHKFQARDGRPLYGHLSCPPGTGPHPAVIVSVAHTGGALDEQGRYFQIYEHSPLVKAGFAVFTVDQHGALGHGAEYRSQAGIGRHDVEDLLAAVDYLEQRPEIDSKRLALVGTCRGSFTSLLALQREPERFRALVLIMGFYDFHAMRAKTEQYLLTSVLDTSVISQITPYLHFFSGMQEANHYPLRNLGAVKVPLWIVHGDDDPLCNVAQSRQLAAAAHALGISTTLTIVPGMGHDLSQQHPAWPALWAQISDFLRQHMDLRQG